MARSLQIMFSKMHIRREGVRGQQTDTRLEEEKHDLYKVSEKIDLDIVSENYDSCHLCLGSS